AGTTSPSASTSPCTARTRSSTPASLARRRSVARASALTSTTVTRAPACASGTAELPLPPPQSRTSSDAPLSDPDRTASSSRRSTTRCRSGAVRSRRLAMSTSAPCSQRVRSSPQTLMRDADHGRRAEPPCSARHRRQQAERALDQRHELVRGMQLILRLTFGYHAVRTRFDGRSLAGGAGEVPGPLGPRGAPRADGAPCAPQPALPSGAGTRREKRCRPSQRSQVREPEALTGLARRRRITQHRSRLLDKRCCAPTRRRVYCGCAHRLLPVSNACSKASRSGRAPQRPRRPPPQRPPPAGPPPWTPPPPP